MTNSGVHDNDDVNARLTITTMNQCVLMAQYAVRSEVVSRANEIEQQIQEGRGDNLPFDRIVSCNIGNPHMLGQSPITYIRQVLSICIYPALLDIPHIFPNDVIHKAQLYLNALPGGVGAYTSSQGITIVREQVAEFITRRDASPCRAENIFLCSGASQAVKIILKALIRNEKDSIMIPIPQYPLYSASITLLGAQALGYHLEETPEWEYCLSNMFDVYANAVSNGSCVRALVIINPCNPTGVTLTKNKMKQIIEFCHQRNILIIADEVYQENIWNDERSFVSFNGFLTKMDCRFADTQQLVSLNSISKGFTGECGLRGGYMALTNISSDVKTQLYKIASIALCSNVIGQIAIGLALTPPQIGDDSFNTYLQEKTKILNDLKQRSVRLVDALNAIDGITCSHIDGAMYVFPRVHLPINAIKEAHKQGQEPDMFYCMQMLNRTGVVTVPGSGFKQRAKTWHFRITILPSNDDLEMIVKRIADFHSKFMIEFKDTN